MRVEFTVQGMTAVQAYDGTTGWMIMPFAGKTDPEKMPEELAGEIEEQADFYGPFVDTEEKGYTLELAGEDEVDGTPVYTVRSPTRTATSPGSTSTRSTAWRSRAAASARCRGSRSRRPPPSATTSRSAT